MLKFLGDKIESTLSASTPLRSAGGTVSNATNTTPIVVTTNAAHGIAANGTITNLVDGGGTGNATVTSAAHGLSAGAFVIIESVVAAGTSGTFDGLGAQAWQITNVTTNTFDLLGSQNVNGVYSSGGTWRVPTAVFIAGMTGLTNANGIFAVKAPASNTLTLLNTVGNGSYGGSPIWWTVPSGAQWATIQAQTGDVNWLADGNDPVVSDGGGNHLVANDTPLRIDAQLFQKFRAINYNASTGAKLVVQFFREI